MSHVQDLVKRYFSIKKNELVVGGITISEIVKNFGTPLYIYDPGIMREKLRRLRRFLPGFDVYYSVKANPNPDVIKVFIQEGCGLEIASKGELALSLKCGCHPSRVFFAGPGKTDQELILGVESGISEFHVESLDEIDRLSSIAVERNVSIGVALRINPSEVAQGGAMQMGGKSIVFGLDEELLEIAADRVRKSEGLLLHGLHVYSGTQILDYNVLLDMYRHILNLAVELVKKIEMPLQTIDFGGGLGIPYFDQEEELQIEELGIQLKTLVKEARANKNLSACKFIIEPGRYLSAEAGLYVAKVIGKKLSRGVAYVIIDGGMNHHLAASGNLGQVIKRNFPVAVANRMGEVDLEPVVIVGPLCTPLDTLARNINLPPLKVGDIVVFFQSGAYGLSASPIGFLSHDRPLEIFVEKGVAQIVRHRSTENDLFSGTTLDSEYYGSS